MGHVILTTLIYDVGLSDHRLLLVIVFAATSANSTSHHLVYREDHCFDPDTFRSDLLESALCECDDRPTVVSA